MKKFYRIFILIIVFFFLSTYNPNKFNLTSKKDNVFFKIQNIIILNNFLLGETLIKKKLNQVYNKNIFLVKRKDIEKLLYKVDFLEKIEVQKKYPNTLIVKIFETKPLAILFKDKAKYFLDNSSNLIHFDNEMNFSHLPSIFGEGAENHFVNFYKKLEDNNFTIKKIKNYYYFQVGRWDLELFNNKIIKLPYDNTEIAIKKSIELLNHQDFENYNIIDLRVDGKIIVE